VPKVICAAKRFNLSMAINQLASVILRLDKNLGGFGLAHRADVDWGRNQQI
jgi:hypothetical protein